MSAYSDAVLATPGLQTFLQLDETAGTTAADSSGNGNAGSYNGGYTLAQAGFGGPGVGPYSVALSGGYVRVPNLLGTAATTALVRIRPSSLADDTRILTSAAAANVGHVRVGSAGNLDVVTTSGNWTALTSGGPIAAGGEYHLAFVYSGAGGTCTAYIDGVYAGQASGVSPVSGPIDVGRRFSDSFGTAFSGRVDDVAVVAGALTATQLLNLYVAAGNPARSQRPATPTRPARLAVAPRWSRGLLAVHVADGGGFRDLLGRTRVTLSGDAAPSRGRYGPAVSFGGASGKAAAANLSLAGLPAFTVAVLARSDSYTGGGFNYRALVDQGGGSPFSLGYFTNTQAIRLTVSGLALSAPPPPGGEWVLFTARFDRGSASIWYGPHRAAAATLGTTSASGSGAYVVGSVDAFSDEEWSGPVALHYAWSRALSDAEVARLAADPFAPVRPAPRRAVVGVVPPAYVFAGGVGWVSGSPFTYLTG